VPTLIKNPAQRGTAADAVVSSLTTAGLGVIVASRAAPLQLLHSIFEASPELKRASALRDEVLLFDDSNAVIVWTVFDSTPGAVAAFVPVPSRMAPGHGARSLRINVLEAMGRIEGVTVETTHLGEVEHDGTVNALYNARALDLAELLAMA
jgi:hypothetical protein